MRKLVIPNRIRTISLFSTAILFLALPGCGKKEPPTGEVSGSVTFQGKPLPEGMVAFINEEGRRGEGAIQDGEYTVPNAPVGACGIEVVVNIPPPAPARAPNMEKRMRAKYEQGRERGAQIPDDVSIDLPKAEKSKAVPIPKKYANRKTSGLTFTVVEGQQTHDITLQP